MFSTNSVVSVGWISRFGARVLNVSQSGSLILCNDGEDLVRTGSCNNYSDRLIRPLWVPFKNFTHFHPWLHGLGQGCLAGEPEVALLLCGCIYGLPSFSGLWVAAATWETKRPCYHGRLFCPEWTMPNSSTYLPPPLCSVSLGTLAEGYFCEPQKRELVAVTMEQGWAPGLWNHIIY